MHGKVGYRNPMLMFSGQDMIKGSELAHYLNYHPKLLDQLPLNSILKPLTVSDRSTGELPRSDLVTSSRTALCQK